jgi:hypothetical protein
MFKQKTYPNMKNTSFIKFYLSLITLSFLLNTTAKSQTTFGLKLGGEQVEANYQDIYFEFVDESPSQDRIIENFSIPEKYLPITITPYLSIMKENYDIDIAIKLGLESEFRTFETSIGVSRKFGNNKEDGYFSAGAELAMGRSRVYLGDIYQNDLYIEINGKEYYERSLSVNYYEQQIKIKPFIRYTKFVMGKYPLTATAGYQYPFSSFNGSVIFKGEDPNSEGGYFNEVVSLNRRNIALFTDGALRKKKVFQQQGIFFNVGMGIPIN